MAAIAFIPGVVRIQRVRMGVPKKDLQKIDSIFRNEKTVR